MVGRSVPVFNDKLLSWKYKHLSWKWEWAVEMVRLSRALDFPLLAGSSPPVTWRMPAIEMPYGAELQEILCVVIGGVDSDDFHALEVIQCMAERRRGGETGVVALQARRGDSVWRSMGSKDWSSGGWGPAALGSVPVQEPDVGANADREPSISTIDQIRQWVSEPVAYRFEYADGLKATMLLMNGLVSDLTFAGRIQGRANPLSTLFYLPPVPNVVCSAALMSKAEETFLTGPTPYPIERWLLTTGLVAAGMQSLAQGQSRIETPHLPVRDQAPEESTLWRT